MQEVVVGLIRQIHSLASLTGRQIGFHFRDMHGGWNPILFRSDAAAFALEFAPATSNRRCTPSDLLGRGITGQGSSWLV
jgi:hypothetical protein